MAQCPTETSNKWCLPMVSKGTKCGIFINDIARGTRDLHSQHICGHLRGALDYLMEILGDRLEEWAHVNLMKFNRDKYKVLNLGRGNTQCQYRLRDDWTESSPAQENLVILLDEKLNVKQQWAPAT